MIKADPVLYDKVTETTEFAFWLNVLCIIGGHSMWSIEDAKNYLRTGSKKRKDWEK